MLFYVITILNIALINFIMIVNINSCDCFNNCPCQLGIYNHISLSGVIVINS